MRRTTKPRWNRMPTGTQTMNHLRFTIKNWNKFFDGSYKKSTIRTKEKQIGHYQADAGSYFNPIKLGEFDIIKIVGKCFGDLGNHDAISDGFNNREELINELMKLNGPLKDSDVVYIHYIINVKREENVKN